jgi:hypothetical protein
MNVNTLLLFLLSFISFSAVSAPQYVNLGKIKKGTEAIINAPLKFIYINSKNAPRSYAALGTHFNTRGGAISPYGDVDYKLYDDKGRIYFQGKVTNYPGYTNFVVSKSSKITFNSLQRYGLPYESAPGREWWLRVWMYNVTPSSFPSDVVNIYSEYSVNSWKVDTRKFTKPGIYQEGIGHNMDNVNTQFNYFDFEVVNEINARCELVNLDGGNVINLGNINAGMEVVTVDKIRLNCTDVYQASVSLTMSDLISGSDNYKSKTVAGGYLQVLDSNNNPVKLDGTKEYKINPGDDNVTTYKILNNAVNVSEGGSFRKQLNITVRME